MNEGVPIAIATGLIWTTIGIVMSLFAKYKLDFKTYYFWNLLFSSMLTAIVFIHWDALAAGALERPAAFIPLTLVSGFLNAVGLVVMQIAMRHGHNGAIWAIGQSALIIPFLFGLLVMGEHGSVMKFCGVALVLAGMSFSALAKRDGATAHRKGFDWLKLALLSFLLFGLGQSLQSVPSYWEGWQDAGGLRPTLGMLGSLFGVLACAIYFGIKLGPGRRILLLALGMSTIGAISIKLFYVSLDRLGACGIASLGFPIIVGSCIVGFSLYSLVALKERTSLALWGGFAVTVAGVFALSIR